MTKKLTSSAILTALGKVKEPELHQDLVTLKMIQNLRIKGSEVSFSIVLTTPACPLRSQIEQEARTAVLAVPGVSAVNIKMESSVPADRRISGTLNLPIRNAIAVASGKGGVGKSTIAANIAIALAQSKACVGLLDADIYGPNLPTMMGIDHMPPFKENKLTPAEAYGVKIMSMGFLVKPGQPLIWRGPMLTAAIRQFLSDVDWGELDYLIIDLPPGTGDAPLSLAQTLPLSGALIVTMPQQVSLEDASRSLEMFRAMGVPILGVVENMSYLSLPDGRRMDIFGSGGGLQLAQTANVPLLGSIPIDPEVRIGGDSGKPVLVARPDSEAARALCSIAEKVAARISIAAIDQNNPPAPANPDRSASRSEK